MITEHQIKSVIKKYYFISVLVLLAFLVFLNYSNYWLIQESIEHRTQLGLSIPQAYPGIGMGGLIVIPNVLLYLVFFSFQRILIKLLCSNDSESSESHT